jgi:hypothetical protein
MCAARTHVPLLCAIRSRTSPWFRPTSRPDGTKPAEVRAHLPGFPGISRALPQVSCHFSASRSRTSPGFPAANRFPGRNPMQVREQMAEMRHMCARRKHLPSFPSIALAGNGPMCATRTHIPSVPSITLVGNGRMCASRTHFLWVPTISLAENRRMCAAPSRAHMRDRRRACAKWFRNTKQFLVAMRVRSDTMPTTSKDGEYPCR